MATTAGLPPYMHPGVPVEQPPHLEGEASLATEILPGPPPISSVQQAAQKRDPRKPSAVFSYLPPVDPGSTYSGIMHGTLIGQETQDGPRTKRSRVDKGTASGRAQRASARNQNGTTAIMPLETTAPADTAVQLNSNLSPIEVEGFPVIVDEPSPSRSTSAHNLLEPPPQATIGRMKRKDKGKGKETDLSLVRVKEEPNHVSIPLPDVHASNLLNNEDHCSSCRSNGALIYCDGCPRAFHLWCLDPPLDSIDESDSRWFCPACMIRKQPPKKPPPSLLSPLIHQLNMSYPVEFQLPDDIRTHFKDVATGPKGNYVDTNEVKPLRINRLGQIEDRDPYRLKDRNGAPVLCFKCGLSTLPRGVAPDTVDINQPHTSTIPKPDPTEHWKNIVSCDFCPLHWHLDCLDPPLPTMPAFNKKWMCPNHAEKVLPLRHRVPKSSTPVAVTKPGQFNNGNVEIIPSHATVPSQPPRHIAVDELLINGRRYRIPERVIVLDFWSKLNRAGSHQEEEKEFSSGLSSPLTSLSSLDDFGDDRSGEDVDMDEEFDDLKAAQMLCGLKMAGAWGFPNRKTIDRGVQASPSELETFLRTKSSSTSDTGIATKRTSARSSTVNGAVRSQQTSSLAGSSTSLSLSLSSGAARRKRSTQSIQPELSSRELRSRTKTVMPDSSLTSVSSKDSMKPDDDQNGKSHQDDPTITVIHRSKKIIHVKVEEAEDPFTLVNGVNAEVGPSTVPLTKTPRKRRGRRTLFKDLEGTKTQAPSQKRGRKRKEREDDNHEFPGKAASTYTAKERRLDHEGKGEKRLTRRHSNRTPSQSRVAAPTPSSVVPNNAPSVPTTPSLKIRLPRLSNVSAAHSTSAPISTGSPNKV